MEQFSVHRNINTATADWAPYLCILQHDTLDLLDTRVVAPLIRQEAFGRPASVLNPLFLVEGESVVLSAVRGQSNNSFDFGPGLAGLIRLPVSTSISSLKSSLPNASKAEL